MSYIEIMHKATIKLPLGSKCKQDNADLYNRLNYTSELYRSALNMYSRYVWVNLPADGKVSIGLVHQMYYPIRDAIPQLGAALVDAAKRQVKDVYKARIVRLKNLNKILQCTKHPLKLHKLNKTINKIKTTCPVFTSLTVNLPATAFSLFKEIGKVSLLLAGSHGHYRLCTTYRACKYYQTQYLSLDDIKTCESKLVCKHGKWYIYLTIEYPISTHISKKDPTVLGVDIGINNFASTYNNVDKESKVIDSTDLLMYLQKMRERKAQLQARGTRSAYRRLEKLNACSCAHVRNTLHIISKGIIQDALSVGCSYISLERLTNIRVTATHRKSYNGVFHTWMFRELQSQIDYKARKAGIRVVYVDPAYTSKTCSACGSRDVRRSGNSFTCFTCNHIDHADANAAKNIVHKGLEKIAARRMKLKQELAR